MTSNTVFRTSCALVLLFWSQQGRAAPVDNKENESSDSKAAVSAALKDLANQRSFRWETVVKATGGRGDSRTTGGYEKDGYTHVVTSSGGGLEFARKGANAAVLREGIWMTLDQAAARAGGGRGGPFGSSTFSRSTVTEFKLPVPQAEEVLERSSHFKKDGETVTAELSSEAASELLLAGTRGGRGGPPGGTIKEAKGSAVFTLTNGALMQLELVLSGMREDRGNQQKLERTTMIRFIDVGSAVVAIPADAKEIIDALAAGKTPNVFVPEPGFKSLFNGRDLTGWVGRPEHWSVVDGAITGKSTAEHPAKGNNFLIAKNGDKSLIVDDFELRFSYRITPNNASGFANSGVQYRSKELPDFVVAGYQGDFEAGNQFSGILYDEGGGAGGRGIMAERGQLVAWSGDGKKSITGALGKSEDIQKSIKKDDWNDFVIIAEGARLQHFINGVQTVGVVDETESKRLASGILAIQLHAGEPMTVQVKNVRIKSLSSHEVVGGGNFKVPKDFKLELLYTVPKETEGSWVAMCVDPKGRLIVSDQSGALYRVTVPQPGTGAGAVRTERLGVDLGGAHGLLYVFDSLYVMVNERNPRALYRARDTDGDDTFDKVELLREIQGGGEHGLHSLALSPDGKSLYVVCGNSTSLTAIASSKAPLGWSEDDILKRLPTGFMDDSLAPQGWIARIDPDGKNWELIAMGFRNPFDIAFNNVGELFTFDADMEWDIGEPWYRPTRVNHVISGAEFGFRNGNGKWPDYYVDSFGSAVDIGPGSPTGITFGYGAKFPAKYQEALFISDWSFGKLRAVHLTPEGSSYRGESEEFVSGQPLPLTDVVINPRDGAMYFAVGGRGAQSALYRLTYTGTESTAPSQPNASLQAQRDLRRRLESFHGHKDPAAVEAVWPYLGDKDRAIRFAARVALEWQDPSEWSGLALGEKDPRTAIASLVALARVSARGASHRKETDPTPDPGLRSRLLGALDAISWPALGRSDQVDLLRAYSLTLGRLGRPDDATRERLVAKLDPRFPAKNREIDALLAQLLVYLESPSAASKIVAALRTAPTQEEQIDYALTLRVLKTGWTMPLREEYFRWFLAAESFRGGNTFASSLHTARTEAVALLTEDEKTALKPILESKSPQKSLRELLAARAQVKAWTLSELVPIVERGLKGGRSFDQGRKLYSGVGCAACHRFVQEGGSVGPDLTGVVGRFNVRDLLESIVEPSKVVSDQYAAIVIQKKNGEIVSGRIGNLSGNSIHVVEDMFDPGRMTGVQREDIEKIEPSTVSMMPEGLLNTLKEEEIADLIAFLLSRGDPQSEMFR